MTRIAQKTGNIKVTGAFVFQGISDEVTVCDCCGKSGLKSTVVFDVAGNIVHYGSTCAARHTGRKTTVWISEEKARVEAIRAQVRAKEWNLPEAVAYRAKQEDARRLKIRPGKDFREFCSVESAAAHTAEARLWTESGVSKY